MISTIHKYLEDAIKYYNLASCKEKQDINKILLSLNKNKISEKQIIRIQKYSKRYKVLTEANHLNSQDRLNKLYRKPLTSPNKDIV